MMEAETTEQAFATEMAVCVMCKESLLGKNPHLLMCLHSVCRSCLSEAGTGTGGERADYFQCPNCSQNSKKSDIIENQIVELLELPGSTEKAVGADEAKVCTGCEESVPATSYCLQCAEYLCEACVAAHKRVKVTKDHVVQPKDMAVPSQAAAPKQQLCPIHLNEPLKLFCKNCDMLTCRDCQLLNHKEHKYQFVNEASVSYKTYLTTLTEKVKEKQAYVMNAKKLIEDRNKEIQDIKVNVTQDIKTFALKCIKEINQRGRNILADLTAICSVKKAQLDQKNKEITGISSKLDHALKFTEFALEKGSDEAILYTKKILLYQLSNILKSRCEVPNPNHVVDIRFSWDAGLVTQVIPKQGMIIVDGVPYAGMQRWTQNTSSASAIASASGSSSGRPLQQMPPISTSVSNPHPQMNPYGNMGNFRPPGNINFAELNNEQRHMLIMKMRQMHEQQRRQRGQGNPSLPPPPNLSPTTNLAAPHFSHHLPNQSSAISSSMMQQQHQHGFFPGAQPHNQVGKSLSNLAGLVPLQQQQHMNRNRGGGYQPASSSTTNGPAPSPIVIQPVDLQNQMGFGSSSKSGGSPTASSSRSSPHGSNSPSPGVGSTVSLPPPARSPSGERPSCSFARPGAKPSAPAEIREPPVSAPSDLFSDFNLGEFNFDDDPLSILESLKKDNDSTALTADTLLDLSKQPASPPVGSSDITAAATAAAAVVAAVAKQENRSSCRFRRSGGEQIDLSADDEEGKKSPPPLQQQHSQGKVMATTPHRERDSTSMRENPDDPSEDWCAVCQNGGDLLCCDYCPKVFHLACHVPTLQDSPKEEEKWQCMLCKPDDELRLETADKRDNHIPTASGAQKRRSHGFLTNKETKVCQRILLELYSCESSAPFHVPVDRSVANYHSIIEHPMDFGTIKRRLKKNGSNHYQTVETFLSDVRLVFANCAKFNHVDSEVAGMGVAVEKFFRQCVTRLLPYIDIEQIPETGCVVDGDGHRERKRKRRTGDKVADDRVLNEDDDSRSSTSISVASDEQRREKREDTVEKDIPKEDNKEKEKETEKAEEPMETEEAKDDAKLPDSDEDTETEDLDKTIEDYGEENS